MRKTAVASPVTAMLLTCSATVNAQTATYPQTIPSPGGEVVLGDQYDKLNYDEVKYAPARRVGDMLYVSGHVVTLREGEAETADSFKEAARRMFRRVNAILKAEGATFADVVKINSFHVWEGPNLKLGKWEQFNTFSAVKDEFMSPPHPAWTAVGTTGLLPARGVAEVEMIVYVPQDRRSRR